MIQLQDIESAIEARLAPLHDRLAAALALRSPQHFMEAVMADAKAAFEQAVSDLKSAVTGEISKLTQKVSDLEAKVAAAPAAGASDDAFTSATNELNALKDSVAGMGDAPPGVVSNTSAASPLPAEASPSAADPSLSPPSLPSIGSSDSDLGAIAQ